MTTPAVVCPIPIASQRSTKVTGGKGGDFFRHTHFNRRIIERGKRAIELAHEGRMSVYLITMSIVVTNANKEDLSLHSQDLSRRD